MSSNHNRFIGLDVHRNSIAVACADGQEPALSLGEIANTPEAMSKLAKKLSGGGRPVQWCYEAGPCGYGIFRQLRGLGHLCIVVAPSLIPHKPGDRVKTDRRDALSLARLHRAGELTAVWVPDEVQESMRDLTRCREDAKQMQRKARQQLGAYLLRYGRTFGESRNWTQKHQAWLEKQRFDSELAQMVFDDYLEAVRRTTDRVVELEGRLQKAAESWSMWPTVQALMALRGVNLIAAMTIVAEIGDLTRFESPRQLMAYLGVVPSEHSSGQKTRRGAITKTGNGHVRRVLVECSWSYRFQARKTKHLQAKARKTSPAVQEIAWKAQRRLCQRYRHLVNRGKLQVQACTAVARELSGFIWAIAREVNVIQRTTGGRSGEPSTAL
jgi:transposase